MKNLGSVIFHSSWHCDSQGDCSCAGEECLFEGNEYFTAMDSETIVGELSLSGTVLLDLAGPKV